MLHHQKTYVTSSAEETQALAKDLIEHIFYTKKVLLEGDLGTGKTTFVKGLAQTLGIHQAISSPTYTYVNRYAIPKNDQGLTTLYHFDLYRLPEAIPQPAETSASIGLEDALTDPQGLVVIEWPERLALTEGLILQFTSTSDHHEISVKGLKED